jgi:chaperone required for assembly of F1-ATPase
MPIPLLTPAKKPFALPTDALTKAIEKEWQTGAKFTPSKMPLTSLAYTAIDRIAPQAEAVVEALLVYADTDTLCYRAPEEDLNMRQKERWDVVLGWSSLMLGVKWQVAEGIMPLDQPEALHKALRTYLETKDAWRLAAFSVLASGFSSLVLAKAVMEKHLSSAQAFELSRLEENYSIEKWGEDPEAAEKAAKLKAEMLDAERFLMLLDA